MDVKATVYQYITEATGLRNFTDSDPLTNLGLDSLDKVEMFMQLEEKFHIDRIDTTNKPIRTVGEVVSIIEAAIENVNPELYELRKNQKQLTSLYTVKNNVPYCRVTERPCKKISTPHPFSTGKTPCERANCVIVNNMKKMLAEMQKTK